MAYTRQQFIDEIAPLAQQDMAKTGILASVTIAQAVLESGDGNSTLTQRANNLFGIKGSYNGQSATFATQEYVNGGYVTVNAAFRSYPSWSASIADHSALLSNSRYNLSGVTDYREACNTLQNKGYATAPNYASTLISLIEQNNLAKYDTATASSTENTVDYAAKLVETALSQEGNTGGQPYWSFMGFGYRVAWCACFVSWCANQAGISTDIIPRTALVHDFRTFAESKGRFYYKGNYTPKAGDIFINESNGASHTGIVVSSDGTMYNTIEGNSSDQCRQRSYPLTNPSLTGFFSPNYPAYSAGSTSQSSSGSSNTVYAKTVLAYLHDISKDKKQATQDIPTASISSTFFSQSEFTNVQLLVFHGKKCFIPVVEDSVKWQLQRRDYPGTLTFTIIPDDTLKFEEGDAVQFRWNNKKIFFGFLFKKKISEDGKMDCTCYDQLRYFKNKDTYVYKMKRLDEVIRMIADDFGLKAGKLDNTQYKIPSRIEDNKTLFDIVGNAIDETLMAKRKLYVLYDDFGALRLRNVTDMVLDLLIDSETGQEYSYESSIDGETYNKVKLSYSNDQIKARELYIAKDADTIAKWGVLQYYETIQSNNQSETGQSSGSAATSLKNKADSLLELYDAKERTLSVSGCFGDTRVRAGSSVVVQLKIDGKQVTQFMMVEKVTHTFKDLTHTMDVTLRGGDFSA